MNKIDSVWTSIEKILDDRNLMNIEIAKEISKNTGYAIAYAEGFIMAAKNMVTGGCITRIVGSSILENIAFNILKKYDLPAKNNIIFALKQYVEYEPNNLKNSKAIQNLIQKIEQQ